MIDPIHGLGRVIAIRLATLGAIILLGCAWLSLTIHAGTTHPAALQSFDTTSATPRAVEESTALAIQRDYTHAWKSLTTALAENRAGLLDENFTGGARQQWQDAIQAQQKNGLSRRILEHGHRLRVTFYSLEGSALEAMDVADLEIEYREGDKLLSSEHIQAHYLVLLTPTENSWKVRSLQEVSSEH